MLDSISDKDFLEDSESNEEFDKKFEDSIQAHRESSRPSSSSSRPKTASRYRDDCESRTNLIAANNFQIYLRLSKFISYKKISRLELSLKLGDYFTAEKLREVFLNLGFELTEGELNFIFRDSGVSKVGLLRLSEFCSKVIEEEMQEEDEEEDENENEDLDEDHLAASIKNNTFTKGLLKEVEDLLIKSSPKLKKTKRSRKPSTKNSEKNTLRSLSRSSASNRPASNPYLKLTMSKNYLKETHQKTLQEKLEIQTTANLYRREFEFDCIQKMGEANEILQMQSSDLSYRAIRKDDRSLMCHIYRKEKFEEEISMHNFLRKWKKLKERKHKAIKTPASQLTSKSISTNNNGKLNKVERQEEVKKLLLETRELTNSLKEQVKVLEEKGIVKRVVEKEAMVLLNSRM